MSEQIGFIGVGSMGGGMAARLLKAGHAVTACDVDPKAAAAIKTAGASVVATPQDVARAAAVVFVCLPSPKVSEEVAAQVSGARGATTLYIETSTIGTACMNKVREVLASAGIALLDAPISGGPAAAATGELSTIISGAQADFDRARPLIDAFAKHVFFLGGEPGQAQIAKLINNMMSMTGRAAAIEGVIMGMRTGIDPRLLADFINVSTGRNLATLDNFPTRLLHVFETGGKKSIGVKDVELYLKEAERLAVPVWATPKVLDLFVEGEAYGVEPPEKLRLTQWVDRLKAARIPDKK